MLMGSLSGVKAKEIRWVILWLWSQRHIGSGGGLFTRSDSAANPLFAERLIVIANCEND
jgi:hypothetical protein